MSNTTPRTLREVALAALAAHEGATGRELDRLARKMGHRISYTTVNHMAAGTYTSRPSRKTLEALAALAKLDPEVVYKAARLPLPMTPLREDLPPDADLLDGSQRRIVVELIRTFAQQNREIETLRSGLAEEVGEVHELRAAANKVPESGPADQPDTIDFSKAARTTKRAPRNVEGDDPRPDDEGPADGA